MGKFSRDKGARKERALVHKFNEIPTCQAERVPLSGAAGGSFGGDIQLKVAMHPERERDMELLVELKARANGEGFKTLERYLGDNDMLVLWKDRDDPMVCLPWKTLERIFNG